MSAPPSSHTLLKALQGLSRLESTPSPLLLLVPQALFIDLSSVPISFQACVHAASPVATA